jgi:hypothetical protein
VTFDWRKEPDCVPIEGVECRWELPRPCKRPSQETCAGYGCDRRGGKVSDAEFEAACAAQARAVAIVEGL